MLINVVSDKTSANKNPMTVPVVMSTPSHGVIV